MKFVHTNIISKDWKRLADFYVNVFDCKIVPPERDQSGEWLSKGTKVKNASLKGVHLRLPGYEEIGPTLEIYQYGDVLGNLPAASNRKGFGHIAFEVEDVKIMVIKIKENGGYSFGEIIEKEIEGVGKLTFTYAKDPDGNIIELQHWKK